MLAIIKKEFKGYFGTPIGYVCIGVFLLAFSLSFYISPYQSGTINFESIFYTFPIVIALIIIVALLTMRTFAEEKKNGTDQLLMTAPISITKIVLAKFIAATLVIVITEICTLMYFAILSFFGMPDIPTSLVALLGFLLLNIAYISFGILASSLTENQIIAGLLTIGFFIINWMLPSLNQVFSNYALIDIFSKFVYGQIDIADTATFVLFTILCLLLTIVGLQRRKSIR